MNTRDFIFQAVRKYKIVLHEYRNYHAFLYSLTHFPPSQTLCQYVCTLLYITAYVDLVQNGTQVLGATNLTVHTAAQNMLSFLRVYYDPVEFRIYPFLTAVVDVEGGVVQGLAWDDACVFCSKSRCLENMYNFDGKLASELGVSSPSKGCYFTEEECNKIQAEGGTDCDITLYAVWTGTDADGKSFQSSGNRFSAFPPGRLQDRLLNQLPDFPSIF